MSAAREEESGALLSQEQKLKRSQAEENVVVTKGKMYTLVAIILVLFGILVSSQLRDWGTYEEQVGSEREVVILDGVVEKQVEVGAAINAEAALVEAEIEETVKDELREESRVPAASGTKEKTKTEKESNKGSGDIDVKVRAIEKKVREKYRMYKKEQAAGTKISKAKKKGSSTSQFDQDVKALIEAFNGSLVPPTYCYTSPTGNKAFPTEPISVSSGGKGVKVVKKKSKKKWDHAVGEVDSLLLGVAKSMLEIGAKDYKCLILHQDCFDPDYSKQANKFFETYEKNYFKKSKLSRAERIGKVQDMKTLRLGSCAFVGNADNTIKGKLGKEIDEHDFVMRFNVITKPYEEAVGSKTDGIFDKLNYHNGPFAGDRTPSRFNLFPKYVPFELNPRKLPGKKPPMIYGSISAFRRDVNAMTGLYKKAKHIHVQLKDSNGKPKEQHPSGGILRVRAVMELLKLGVCDRLDLYGFSSGGGKYFLQRMKVSHAHAIAAENYIYKLWMASGVHGKFCMYGK